MRQRSRIRSRAIEATLFLTLLPIVAALGMAAASAESPAEREQLAARGAVTYRVYCRTCHGTAGRGDGPLAELLKTPPADLTAISRRAGGEYPEDQVTATVDGRAEVAAHGPREMPIWGEAFGPIEAGSGDEDAIARKIHEVVLYLGTIQK